MGAKLPRLHLKQVRAQSRTHLLHCMKGSTMTTHTATNDNQIVVILGACLGDNGHALWPGRANCYVPARSQCGINA